MNCLLSRLFLFSILFFWNVDYLCSGALRNPFEMVAQTSLGVKPFRLLGIVIVDHERSALLKADDVTHIVSVGDLVGQYRVISISHIQVTLEGKDRERQDISF